MCMCATHSSKQQEQAGERRRGEMYHGIVFEQNDDKMNETAPFVCLIDFFHSDPPANLLIAEGYYPQSYSHPGLIFPLGLSGRPLDLWELVTYYHQAL